MFLSFKCDKLEVDNFFDIQMRPIQKNISCFYVVNLDVDVFYSALTRTWLKVYCDLYITISVVFHPILKNYEITFF